MPEITVEREQGLVLARMDVSGQTSSEGNEHRWWFDETDAGRLALVSEVFTVAGGRTYVPYHDMSVPDAVSDELRDAGHDGTLVDKRGKAL